MAATFEANYGDQKITLSFPLRDGKPDKLGDGSFGAVFRVVGPDGTDFAAKLFYATTDKSLLDRYRLEMRAKESVQAGLRKIRMPDLLGNLVLAEYWTETFHESDAYKDPTLKKHFDDLSLKLCGFAAVMPLFNCTMKELLEHGAPAGRLVGGDTDSACGTRGYELLKAMAFPEREAALLPISLRVAYGLRALHAAELSHHDLKPANILVKGTANGVDFSLADFGFVRPNQYAFSEFRHVGAAIPTGTRHYRSIEQRDYFDVCEVDVSVQDQSIQLTTVDLKFQDSIIEPGDSVTFFKNPTDVFTVDSISHDTDHGMTVIKLEANKQAPPTDTRTQAIFYKHQTLRTDLFGLGALIFDLLTAGRSAERFTEFLRPWDRPKRSVSELLSKYRTFIGSSAGGPDVVAVFEQLRRAKDFTYPTPDVIEIMLTDRCAKIFT